VIESFQLLKHIYHIPHSRFESNLSEIGKLLNLDPFLDTPVRSLSLGQRMRADLCAALLHDPPVVLLDEPTIGLDVVAKEHIRRFIQHLNQQRNTTVILTTHDLSDVARLCKRVIIIDQGQLVYDGWLETLREKYGTRRELVVDFEKEYAGIQLHGAMIENVDGLRVTYSFERQETAASELILQISSQYKIRDLAVREPDIETTIRRIYQEGLLRQSPGEGSGLNAGLP
jgi:ABC-2 type transport system ATP-binding protein